MNHDLHQQLLEFVYDLLDESEASEVRARITSDPDVARAYAEVMLQTNLVSKAARYAASTVAWVRPAEETSPDGAVERPQAAWSQSLAAKTANWCMASVALALVCLLAAVPLLERRAARNQRPPLAEATTPPLRAVVTGPSTLHAEARNQFTIQTTDLQGVPVSTSMRYRVIDVDGNVTQEASQSTDRRGIANIEVLASLGREPLQFEVAPIQPTHQPLTRNLEVSPTQFVTYLRIDKPLYRPGEQLYFRTVTLSRFGLRVEREVRVLAEIVDSQGQPVPDSQLDVESTSGVGSGTVELPADLSDGRYTLVVRSPEQLFPEEWRDFEVREFRAPQVLKQLELARDSYTSGDQVDVSFLARRASGTAFADAPLEIKAQVDGQELIVPQAKTDTDGKVAFNFRLPESIERGQASVSVTVQDAETERETVSKDIPINLGKVNVDFFPEGGELAADLPNRVYFFGRDPLGKPTHVEGRIVDSQAQEIVPVATIHEGRGVFAFTPHAGQDYRLLIDKPVGVTKELPLPVATQSQTATLHTGQGVFPAASTIRFTIYQRSPPRALVVAAYCRGAMVGQQTIEPTAYQTHDAGVMFARSEIDVAEPAQGVIRLTLFESDSRTPTPLAERLIYRRVARQLDVQLSADQPTFAPGDPVQLNLTVRDEQQNPVSAVLGISVVDDAILNLADDRSTRLPTFFHLLTEIETPDRLEDANFYLSDQPLAEQALDLLLGTQGWRRFVHGPPVNQAASGLMPGAFIEARQAAESLRRSRHLVTSSADEMSVPLRDEMVFAVSTLSADERESRRDVQPNVLGWLATLLVIGGGSVLAMVVVSVLLRTVHHWRVWGPSIAVAGLSLVVGLGWLLSRGSPVGDLAVSTSAPAIKAVASADDYAKDVVDFDELSFRQAPESRIAEQVPNALPYEAKQSAGMAGGPESDPILAAPRVQDPAPEVVAEDRKLQAGRAAIEKAETDPPAPSKAMSRFGAPQAAPEAEGLAKQNQLRDAASLADRMSRVDDPVWFRQYADPLDADLPFLLNARPFSGTLLWQPLFTTDARGEATLHFSLPKSPSAFRTLVEAHGDDRLGAGELLITPAVP